MYNLHNKIGRVFRKCTVKVLVAQSRPTLCDSLDCRPPGFSVNGISQARVLEWIAISFPVGSSGPRDRIDICITGEFFTTEPPGKPKCSELRFRKKKASVCARWWGESFLCIVVELNESIYVKHSSLCLAYSSSCYSVTQSCSTLRPQGL